jgi:Putative polyhydroxyalkanoic acid system protein (PHA_gran_rgn)
MQKPIVVYVRHQLGREEAIRRIKHGISRVTGGVGGQFLMSETKWNDNHLDFRASLLGQSAFGTLDVDDEQLRIEVTLPFVLHFVAEKAKMLVQRQGQLLLENKRDR